MLTHETGDIGTMTHVDSMPVECRLILLGGMPARLKRQLMSSVRAEFLPIGRAGGVPTYDGSRVGKVVVCGACSTSWLLFQLLTTPW